MDTTCMRPRALARPFLTLAALLFVVSSAPAQLAPTGTEFLVNNNTNYSQYWPRVAMNADRSLIAYSYNSGQNVFARLFDGNFNALTGDLLCNNLITTGIQDEAEIAMATNGNVLIAWSERSGGDGEQMGIFGRIFTPTGAALGSEFQINEVWQASQWRPLIAPRPSGGWVVAWSGEWDGEAIMRVLDSDGTFLSGDIQVNTFENGAQVDTALAIADDGTMFMVFVDYSGTAGIGSGTNLWGRMFDEDGVAQQPSEFPLNTSGYTNLDQREPRVAADGQGNFIVSWEDQAKDGGNWGIFARRFDSSGTPLASEFLVNTTTPGAQRNPRVAASASGEFVITWEHWSSGQADVMAQRFDANAQPIDGEFMVNTTTTGDQRRPSLAMTPSGDEVLFTFEGPGNVVDCFTRLYLDYAEPAVYCTALVNSQGCTPSIGYSGSSTLSGADDFMVTSTMVLNEKNGIMFYGFAPNAVPFKGGTLCVQQPLKRTPLQNSGGNAGPDDCSGNLSFHFSQAYMTSNGLGAGTMVYAQFWHRDPASAPPGKVGLTDGLSFEIRP